MSEGAKIVLTWVGALAFCLVVLAGVYLGARALFEAAI